MFINAIDSVSKFTRAIHSISRNYNSETIQRGAATIFIVNSDGWALTCKHVAGQIPAAKQINEKSTNFKKEFAARKGTEKQNRLIRELETKFGYSKRIPFELKNTFMNCAEGGTGFSVKVHPKYDVALIKFDGFTRLLCESFPVFPSDTSGLKQGKYLCRLGFPFPEFTNYEYDKASDQIHWTDFGQKSSPRFPIEGMVTRNGLDGEGNKFAFELSTPGLRGQSGGPAFDTDGVIWGMQSQTGHLDLDFDVDQEVLRQGIKKQVKDSTFLHVGVCIHVDILKAFMNDNNVSFNEI